MEAQAAQEVTDTETRTTLLVGHAHLDLAWVWTPSEARVEALDTARAVAALLEEHPQAQFLMSQAAQWQWIADDDPALLARLRVLVEAGRLEPVGGWWVEPDLFGASPASIRKQADVGQRAFEDLAGRRCTIGFAPDTFGHPAWLPELLLEAGLDVYVITRPGAHEADLPPAFWWEGDGGARVKVARPVLYAGPPHLDPSGLCLYGVGNHGGGPTRAHLAEADALDGARHGRLQEWPTMVGDDLPVVTGDLVHHARGCYATLLSFKERMRAAEQRLLQTGGGDGAWRRLLFWQFHDVLAGSSIPDVYEEADHDLSEIGRSPLPAPTEAFTFVPRHRVDEGRPLMARETQGLAWDGWLPVSLVATGPASAVVVEGGRADLRAVEQYGTAWRLDILLHLTLAAHEERLLPWDRIAGDVPLRPAPPTGLRLAVVEDGTDTWGHGLVRYGPEADPGAPTSLSLSGGLDGLVEVRGEWHERDRALKLCVPSAAAPTSGEMPGGEWDGPVWGRVWSYDIVPGWLRITLRRSPPFAQHDPIGREPGVEHRWTEQGPLRARLWLQPQPMRLPPLICVV